MYTDSERERARERERERCIYMYTEHVEACRGHCEFRNIVHIRFPERLGAVLWGGYRGHFILSISEPGSMNQLLAVTSIPKGTKGHINKRILHSSSKAHYKGDTKNHVLQDTYVCGLLRSKSLIARAPRYPKHIHRLQSAFTPRVIACIEIQHPGWSLTKRVCRGRGLHCKGLW